MRVYDIQKKLSKYTRDTPDYNINISLEKDIGPIILVNDTIYPINKFKLLQAKLRDRNIQIHNITINIIED